jgi:hypothetical protein
VRKAYELYFGYKIGDQGIKFGHQGFVYLWPKFPKISEAKKQGEIFIGPQITQLFKDQDFSTKLNTTDRRDREAF